MKSFTLTLSFFLIACSQLTAQYLNSPAFLKPEKDFENIWSTVIHSDSLSTSTLIWIKKEVKAHRHAKHTEQVYVLEGSADMKIDSEMISIVSGDLIFIPKNVVHSLKVTSGEPLKVISFQSPQFLGKDRIFVKEKR
ncbi:MAG: cupin domain-containing protein [Vicingaceae bacterium]